MHQKYIKGCCVGTAAKRLPRREMRDARRGGRQMASSTVSTLSQAGRTGKMQPQSLQMTPWETGVVTHGTNSAARTLQREPDSHLHCQRKGYFWKMGPLLWFNSLTNPRKRGFSPGEAMWFRLRLHFGLDLLTVSSLNFTQTHARMCTTRTRRSPNDSFSVSPPNEVRRNGRGMRMFLKKYLQYTAEQTNKCSLGLCMPEVRYISVHPARWVVGSDETATELLFQAFSKASARCSLL